MSQRECPDCGGSGYQVSRMDQFANTYRIPCPKCKGKGVLPSKFKEGKRDDCQRTLA